MIKKIDKGYSFGTPYRYLGGSFLLLGVYNFSSSIFDLDWDYLLVGIVFVFAGVVMLFAKEFILINYMDKTLKSELNILGLKFGKQNDLTKYRDISIISRRFKHDDSFTDNTDRFYETERGHTYKHDLVFLTPKHLGRLLISQFDDYEEAVELGKVVSKYTGKPLVKYSPQRISKRR